VGIGNGKRFGFGAFLDSAEVLAPKALEGFGPLMKRAERFAFGAVEPVAAVSANGYQADVFENAEVLGDARLFEAERGDYVAHGALLKGQKREDRSAARFCDSVEGVGGGGGARHAINIYPYRNMSREFFAGGLATPLGAGFRALAVGSSGKERAAA
jgi:hypothetical protein